MDPIEALLTKKLDELESKVYFFENPKETHFPDPLAAALLSKLSFLKSLLAAEIGGNKAAARLNHIADRISALESFFSGADNPKTFRLRLVVLHKNLQELESMANEPFWNQSAAKIRSKIDFTKSLLAVDDQSEDLSSLRARIAAVEEAFVHLNVYDRTQPSCSSTSCHTEEVGEEEAVALSLRKKIVEIEKENNGDDYDDVQTKIGFLRSLLATEKKWKGEGKAGEFDDFVKRHSSIRSEFADLNGVLDDAIGGNASSSCSCTSSCFDGGEEEKQAEQEEKCELCAVGTEEVMEVKSETAPDFKEGDGERIFGKLRGMGAMAGVFAVAAVGVAVGSLFSEKGMVYPVPT